MAAEVKNLFDGKMGKCRTCYATNSDNFHPLKESVPDFALSQKTLAEILWDVTKVDVNLDTRNSFELPEHLCGSCTKKLLDALDFVLQARQVNERLLFDLSIKKGEGSRPLDCLVEAPIDMPLRALDSVQVKIETDYGDGDGDGYEATTTSCLKTNEGGVIRTMEDETYNHSADDDVAMKEELGFSGNLSNFNADGSTAVLSKIDPITVGDICWHGDEDERADEDGISNNNLGDEDEGSHQTEESEEEYLRPKRRRSRRQMSKRLAECGNGKGTYVCEVCNRSFSWLKDLQRHKHIHFGTPDFKCDFCERKFLRKDKLKDHMRTHLKNLSKAINTSSETETVVQSVWEHFYSEQPFQRVSCRLCQKHCRLIKELRQHMPHHAKDTFQVDLNGDICREFYAGIEDVEAIKKAISVDIATGRCSKYCDIVNAFGYEMSLSDSDDDDTDADDAVGSTKYKCDLCSASFRRKYQVFFHARDEHRKNESLPYKCQVCSIEFVSREIYEQHVRSQCYNKEKRYECQICRGRFMWSKNLESHQCRLHSKALERRCAGADSTFKSERGHVKSAYSPGSGNEVKQCHGRRLECCLCGHTPRTLFELRSHLQQHVNGSCEINVEAGKYFKIYRQPDQLTADLQQQKLTHFFSAIDSSGNEMDFSDSDADSDTNGEGEGQMIIAYKCDLCSHTCSRRRQLLAHQNIEHQAKDDLPHGCQSCKRRFCSLPLLQHHLKRMCNNPMKVHRCEDCEQRFVWMENLQTHRRLKHDSAESETRAASASPQKLQCSFCEKFFKWPKDLSRHKRIHRADVEKFECLFCDRKFNRKDNMRSHLKVHGASAAVYNAVKPPKMKGVDVNLSKPHGCKIIQCMICQSRHSKISDLRTHLRTHEYVVKFDQRQESVTDISLQLYPDMTPMSEKALVKQVRSDVQAQRLSRFYSITNEVGYELDISSSETDSDSEDDQNQMQPSHGDGGDRGRYICDLCGLTFGRKYKIFDHQSRAHSWLEAPHVCGCCNARFLSNTLLQLHFKRQCRNPEKRYQCRKCPFKFMWKENLKTHFGAVHAESWETKVKTDKPSSFECFECKRSFRMRKDLTRHMVMHQRDAYVLKCLYCPRKFTRQENLYMHMQRHGISPADVPTAECLIQSMITANGSKEIYCRICNLKFDSISALREHLLAATNETTRKSNHLLPHDSPLNYSIRNKLGFELDLNDSDTDEADGDAGSSKRQYTCEICNLVCKRKFAIGQHQLAMHKHEQLPYKCDRCIFRSVSKDILDHHKLNQCHNEFKRFQCPKCAFKFMWQENLQQHIHLHHPPPESTANERLREEPDQSSSLPKVSDKFSGAPPDGDSKIFQCDKCKCKYNRKDRLSAHKKKMHSGLPVPAKVKKSALASSTFSGETAFGRATMKRAGSIEKKFLCAFCGRAVTSSSNLIIHMRRHTGEKPFKCDFCDMAFPRSSDLQCHRRTHTGEKPHKCTVCDKAFSRSYKLQTHMRIHSGERPYKCTYCDKSFTQSNDLTLHVRRHTGERPYMCGICGERFIQGTALKNHRTMRGHYEDVEPRRSILEQF